MLTDAQYSRLRSECARTGVSLAELIRRALDQQYEQLSDVDRRRLLDSAFGAWAGREEDGAEYVDRIRTGTTRRLSGAR
ncbi:MAG: CopG family transcriptional regulator [Solirubrobacterales bacterium]|nr:MAG: CopG family transcriptional regulator [Solirubrobacterales bacterium]